MIARTPVDFAPLPYMRLSKTPIGQKKFKDRSVPLTLSQRAAFIIFDGQRTVADVLEETQGLGLGIDDIARMVQLHFLAPTGVQEVFTVSKFQATEFLKYSDENAELLVEIESTIEPEIVAIELSLLERHQRAHPIALALVSKLGLRAFRLNALVRAANDAPELLLLLPRIEAAVGEDACVLLRRTLLF